MKKIPQEVELVGERLILRSPPKEQYDDESRIFYSERRNMKYLPFFSKEWTKEEITTRRGSQRLNQQQQRALNYDIFDKNTNRLIGIGGFRIIDKEMESGEFGIILDYSVWRQGLSTEAHLLFFEHAIEILGLEDLYAGTSKENQPMISFFHRYGILFRETVIDNDMPWNRYGFIGTKDWPSIKEKMQEALKHQNKPPTSS